MEKVLTPFLSTNHGGGNSLSCNKWIDKGDFLSLTDGGWKMFAELRKRMEYINFTALSHTVQIHKSPRVSQREK